MSTSGWSLVSDKIWYPLPNKKLVVTGLSVRPSAHPHHHTQTNIGVMNGLLKFLTARKILPLLDLLAKFKRVLACSCSPNFCVAHMFAKQIFYFCSYSQKNRSARHARECSQRPFVTPQHDTAHSCNMKHRMANRAFEK